MLASRKALLSNLNYVHLQHVSLGVHLSLHPEMTEAPRNQDLGLTAQCPHKWENPTLADPNSNDPSMPCQCCDQHGDQEVSSQYSSLEDLDTIICDECLSPDDLPLSPLSLSSPSTDSSSSSDFTLDDSPASMYYKEYSQDGLDTPDQQPDIIPLDAATDGPFSARGLSPPKAETIVNGNESETGDLVMNNNNMEDPPFIDWGSDSMVDSNSNTLIEELGSISTDSDTTEEPAEQMSSAGPDDHWPEEHNLLPELPAQDQTSTVTPKKTITSFHELALRRRRSGGQISSQPKRDRSDWLIVFSPDTEQPPMNELTASAFYHGLLEAQTLPKPAGKEVTTFRELRYRNAMNKQGLQQIKVHEEMPKTTDPPSTAWDTDDCLQKTENDHPDGLACRGDPQTADAGQDRTLSIPRNKPTKLQEDTEASPTAAVAWNRGLADGGDRRGQEASECELFMADDEDAAQRQKKSLLIAVGSAVEKIISHFNMSRNQVQKAQLGDSRLSPVLGYLILNHLCPSLYSLLGDGLKPYQKDVIVGRRRLSPWSLVEASSKMGPETVHLLFSKVSRLPQLRDPHRKFNAFIFGLLNMKQLDVWVLHLHQIYDQLSICYLPSGFLPLAATSRLELRDELLLSLQPLSALTFHTDLLFEHHHLSLQDLPTTHTAQGPGRLSDNWVAPSLQNILDLGGWITHNLMWSSDSKKVLASLGDEGPADGSQGGAVAGGSMCAPDTSVHPGDTTRHRKQPAHGTENSPTPSSWWGHLGQASRVYSPVNRESLSFSSLRKLTSWGSIDREPNQRASKEDFPEQRLSKELTGGLSTGNEEDDPPEAATADVERVPALANMEGAEEKGTWLGQLFGANSSHGQEPEARNSKSRRPSSWLPPNINVWSLMKKQTPVVKPDEPEPRRVDEGRAQRSLRALCDHIASGESQLSFQKGEVLQLLGTVDEDWIQCRRGGDTGLVPVGYTSLIL